MIRIGLPFPTLYRVSLRAQLFSARVSRSFREFLLGEPRNLDFLEAHIAVDERIPISALEPVDLDKFDRRFQDLVDLLCVAAKDGATIERSEHYMDLQDWFGRNYGIYRGILLPYLRLEPNEPDPFESIFMHESLKDAIHADELILQIQHTRHALQACIDHAAHTPV